VNAARLAAAGLTLEVGGRTLCRDLDVGFAAGENWAILGANGSGKTTLLHTLAGLRAPAAGAVRLDAAALDALPARERARRLGVLFQDYEAPMPASVLETVLTGRHPHLTRFAWEGPADVAAAEAALAAVGLTGFGARALATLSGGERRRAEIAALLAQDAPILLLDEPTNHLDLHHQGELLARLAARARRPGHLNLFVLHDVNAALRHCDHALLLYGDGECRHGPIEAVATRAALERLYGCRLRELADAAGRGYLPA
jgi:iron complex transport system ATP-binding protein